MKTNKWLGKMILFAGLDGAGKTTVSREVIKSMASNYNIFYCKGVGSDTFFGRLARRFAKTPLFLCELIWITHFSIKPALIKGRNVLQDKYFFFVASHIPDVEKKLNKLLIRLSGPLLIEPDLIIYFQVSLEERIKRLIPSIQENRFHKMLVDNPELIVQREKKYMERLRPYKDKVIFLDTTGKSIKEVVEITKEKIISFLRKENVL